LLTEDYILRMINQAVAALLKAAGLKKRGKYEEACQAIDQALTGLTGMDAGLVKQLDDRSLLTALTTPLGLDTARLAAVARLFKAEGEVLEAQKRLAESTMDYLRALSFSLEAALHGETDPALAADIDELVRRLQGTPLPLETQGLLQDYEQESQ
jgi:hypothetical protein